MGERKTEKRTVFQEYVRVISEILATRGKDAEHFVKVFQHEPDNVAHAGLGTLLGVFEIDDHNEDSRYIVNFLFSVAKNEYFCNPRRGAMESFESALHKINIALAEIVKHGNTSWLGKFHGTIAVLEKNSIHLSATGGGRIYLVRNQTCSHISDGLTSSDAADHPIKTFIETSSGRLSANDRLIFILPKALDVIGEDLLSRQARHMDTYRFAQFLRTAIVNELDQSGAIIIDIEEPLPRIRPKKTTKQQSLPIQSYFSEAAFEKKHTESIAVALGAENLDSTHHNVNPDYTDTKTGHIYVRGEHTDETNNPSALSVSFKEIAHFLHVYTKKVIHMLPILFHKLRGSFAQRSICLIQYIQSILRHIPIHSSSRADNTKHTVYPDALLLDQSSSVQKQSFQSAFTHSSSSDTYQSLQHVISSVRTKDIRLVRQKFCSFLASLYSKVPLQEITRMLLTLSRALRLSSNNMRYHRMHLVLHSVSQRFLRLSKGIQYLIAVFFLLTIGLFGWYLFDAASSSERIGQEIEEAPSLLDNTTSRDDWESLGALFPDTQLVLQHGQTVVPVYLNDTLLIITQTTIEIPSLDSSTPLPDHIQNHIQSATPMHDLRLLFLITDTGTILSFSPTNGVFTENTLPNYSDTIGSIGTYLTYLYILNKDGTTIYRFPRTTGGFGEGTQWLKQPLDQDTSAHFAVSDTLFVFSNKTLTQFSRGKINNTFELPQPNPTQLLLATESENNRVVGLSRDTGQLIVWNTDGVITHQFFSDTLKEVTGVTLHGDTLAFSNNTETKQLSLP